MRELERTTPFVDAKKAIVERDHLLSYVEWEMWSKRAHGDIYALVQVSVTLRDRDGDVRGAIIREVPFGVMANVLLLRAIEFSLVLTKHVIEEFGIGRAIEPLGNAIRSYEKMQERDLAQRSSQPLK